MRGALLALAVCLVTAGGAAAQQPPPRRDNIRIFLDCSRCDDDYIRREITFVDYMRDRRDADVHVLVTTQTNGGGGMEYTIKFIGLGPFAGVEQTLRYNSPQTATSDERRVGITETLKRGLVRYAAESPAGRRLKITFEEDKSAARSGAKDDPWNLWVFRINSGGDFEGEESTNSQSFRAAASANRTTDAWKLSFSASTRYSSSEYDLGDGEMYTSVSRNFNIEGAVVKSLTQHWSLGLEGELAGSTYTNYDHRLRVAPGVEYNVFPYSESTRRMLTVQYTVGVDSHDYREITIYDKTEEQLLDHRLQTALSLRQPWGTASSSVTFSQVP